MKVSKRLLVGTRELEMKMTSRFFDSQPVSESVLV